MHFQGARALGGSARYVVLGYALTAPFDAFLRLFGLVGGGKEEDRKIPKLSDD